MVADNDDADHVDKDGRHIIPGLKDTTDHDATCTADADNTEPDMDYK